MATAANGSPATASRYSNALRILGPDLVHRVHTARVLCVGAGGIGCELLKNLVMVGFVNIEIIDLDTIDLSNLNRQFLFQKQHVKRSKSLVARETATQFNPDTKITARHGNIKDTEYDVAFFKSFDVVLNALDNADARHHVNKMCLAADVPLVESGTTGYVGQVQPIKKDDTECYACQPKETPKSFPVCTIRSTPSTPIHCIVWAKSYLFPQLFGPPDDSDTQELDRAADAGENKGEIEELKKEAAAMREIRATLSEQGAAKRVFDKVFKADIERLLKMDDMWRNRKRPVPFTYDDLVAGKTDNEPLSQAAAAPMVAVPSAPSTSANGTDRSSGQLKDQRDLSLLDSFKLYQSSFERLAARVKANPNEPLEWDKDDEDALDFATATANIRSTAFSIQRKSRFDVKAMAGSIIAAIATTNAIIAGLLVLQALHVLRNTWSAARITFFRRVPYISSLVPPSDSCAVCKTVYVPLSVQPGKMTLGKVIGEVVRGTGPGGLGVSEDVGLSVSIGKALVWDEDFTDNEERMLESLGVTGKGEMITVNDEDGGLWPVELIITALPTSSDVTTLWTTDLTKVKLPVPSRPPKPEQKDNVSDSDDDDGFEVTDGPVTLPAPTVGKSAERKRTAEVAELDETEVTKKKKVEKAEGTGSSEMPIEL